MTNARAERRRSEGNSTDLGDVIRAMQEKIDGPGDVTLDDVHRTQIVILQGLGQLINQMQLVHQMAIRAGMKSGVLRPSGLVVPTLGRPDNGETR